MAVTQHRMCGDIDFEADRDCEAADDRAAMGVSTYCVSKRDWPGKKRFIVAERRESIINPWPQLNPPFEPGQNPLKST
jgi:hypothetical protein